MSAGQWGTLPDWARDQAGDVLPVYLRSAPAGWPRPRTGQDAAEFLADAFVSHRPADESSALFTGYFEPEIEARLYREPGFETPLYRLPSDPGLTRAQIAGGGLAGQGLEIAWLADPVDAYFLEVQGSGRLCLPHGQVLRVGYAGKNGHPYRSLGKEMIARGLIAAQDMTADAIRDWLRRHPGAVDELLHCNPSYVYFRARPDLDPADGPIGTAGVPLTPLRSIAVDPSHTPLGAIVLLETTFDGAPARFLAVAQDTGGVIKGAQRADIFFGTGAEAGQRAGRQAATGVLVHLRPKDI